MRTGGERNAAGRNFEGRYLLSYLLVRFSLLPSALARLVRHSCIVCIKQPLSASELEYYRGYLHGLKPLTKGAHLEVHRTRLQRIHAGYQP